jgi:hypothetical protein
MNRQEMESLLVEVREFTPRLWWNLYQGSLEAGFDERQAMSLLHTFILSQNPKGIKPNVEDGPASDKPRE